MCFINDICDDISIMLNYSIRNKRVFFDEEMSVVELFGLPSACSRFLGFELLAHNTSAFLLSHVSQMDGVPHFFFVALDDEVELDNFPTVPKFDIFHTTDYEDAYGRFAKYSSI